MEKKPKSSLIEGIDENGIVTCVDTMPHDLSENDIVKISHFKDEELQVKIIDRFKFKINKLKKSYLNGKFCQIKKPEIKSFEPINKSYLNPVILDDFSNFEKPKLLHIIYLGINLFNINHSS